MVQGLLVNVELFLSCFFQGLALPKQPALVGLYLEAQQHNLLLEAHCLELQVVEDVSIHVY